jgi:hypothetical protein
VGERRYRYKLEKDWRKLESMMEILHLRKFEKKTRDNPLPSNPTRILYDIRGSLR